MVAALTPSADAVARALLTVADRLGDRPGYVRRLDAFTFRRGNTWPRALWLTLWALTAAYPTRSPAGWAPLLGLDPELALTMLGRCRGMAWWDWSAVIEAVVILAGDDA